MKRKTLVTIVVCTLLTTSVFSSNGIKHAEKNQSSNSEMTHTSDDELSRLLFDDQGLVTGVMADKLMNDLGEPVNIVTAADYDDTESISSLAFPEYQFHYYVECGGGGIGEAHSGYSECDGFGFQSLHLADPLPGRFNGPTAGWLDSIEYHSWAPFVPSGYPQPGPTDLLVYEDATPASGECFPPESAYYGRIPEDGTLEGRGGVPKTYRPGHSYYFTTCGFETLYPHHPIKPPEFTITYGFSCEEAVEGDAVVSAWSWRKEIDRTPFVCMGRVTEFYLIYNGETYYDNDEDGRIDVGYFDVWIENDWGEVGRFCDSTIYANGWIIPIDVEIGPYYSSCDLHCGVVELYIRVTKEAYSNRIYDIIILPEIQQPAWESVEALGAPEGWSFEEIDNGVRFYTETNPLLKCQRTKFKFRVKAKRISWYIRVLHVVDKNFESTGMIVSTRRWLYYFYLM